MLSCEKVYAVFQFENMITNTNKDLPKFLKLFKHINNKEKLLFW